MLNVRVCGSISAFSELLSVSSLILFLQNAHLFYLVQIYHKALVHVMEVLNALSTENRWMFTAVEMLDALIVHLTKIGSHFDLEFWVFFVCV